MSDTAGKAAIAAVWGDGHDVQNHGWNAVNISAISSNKTAMDQEVLQTEELIKSVIPGHRPYLYRPSYGAIDDASRQYLNVSITSITCSLPVLLLTNVIVSCMSDTFSSQHGVLNCTGAIICDYERDPTSVQEMALCLRDSSTCAGAGITLHNQQDYNFVTVQDCVKAHVQPNVTPTYVKAGCGAAIAFLLIFLMACL
eukprot:gene8565-7817_t